MKQLTLRRPLILLGSSILVLTSVLVSQVYAAGAIPALGATPSSQNITLYGDRRADWWWIANAPQDDDPLVSVREYVGQHGDFNNFPGLPENVQRTAHWYYDPYVVPTTFENRWYGEGGTWYAPRYYRLSTWVYGN
jgi:hypothetical protein